ncbi:hypothetical protein [Micromonospora sp. bgisy143]|uniref:hypothetical protein n=1 Tax=Micromonospora sp. bgisy143 TaxID=3413790 RepID=UPI003EB833AF
MPAAPGATFRAGDLLRLSATASVQFLRPITVRVIRELEWDAYDGWVWLDAYELGVRGDAVARRELYVRREGVQLLKARLPVCTR